MEESDSGPLTNPFDLFVSECNDIDVEVRISSIKKLTTVAVDTERTTNELIPFLDTLTEGIYNDDEVSLNLAEQLGNFLPFIGGTENAGLLLNILEKLASVEENVVREKAIESLCKIANALETTNLENLFVPLIMKLADSEWFTSKSSGAALFSVCYSKVSDDIKTDLRNAYRVLCQDDSPLVRRAAAAQISDFAKVLEVEHLKNEFIPVFDNFSKDDQDSVRVLAIDVGISIASRLTTKEVEEFILPTLIDLCIDPSWRVRYQVSNQINLMQQALGYELTQKHLVGVYQNLVHDSEPQVRETSAKRVVGFCEILQKSYKENEGKGIDPIITNQIFPLIQDLDQDSNPEVKEALSSVITELSPLLGIENTKALLLPLITTSLLNDSSRVRENIIANLNNIISVIGISDIADTVLKIVIDLVNNSASVWRTRRNLIVTINYMAKHSGKEYFDTYLKSLYQKLLSDGVYAVRKTAPLILPILAKNFGIKWATNSIVPEFLTFAEHKHYLYRYVCLFCIDELVSPTLETKSATTEQPKLLHLQENPPDNISAILDEINKLTKTLSDKLKEPWVEEALKILEEDDITDDDIKKYAEDTIEMFIRDNNLDISRLSIEELQTDDVYLVGVLQLIQNKFLGILEKLIQDPVPNIRIKVAKTIERIISLNTSLTKELQDANISKFLSSIEPEPNVRQQESEDVVMDEDEIKPKQNEEKLVMEEPELPPKTERPLEERTLETELVQILEEKLQAENDNEQC